jgi:hypothetical protein
MLPRHTGTPRRHQRVPSHTQAPSEENETANMEGKQTILLYTESRHRAGCNLEWQPTGRSKHVGFGSSEPDSVSREFDSRW